MDVVVLSMMALGFSYLLNRFLLEGIGEYAICFGAPIIEEITKTLPAYMMDRSIFHVHLLFGIGEAVFDLVNGQRDTGKWAAVASILSHSVFGGTAVLTLSYTARAEFALLASILLHIGWNYIIMRTGKVGHGR